jgi:hypothetical protein
MLALTGAGQANIAIMRAFVRLREMLLTPRPGMPARFSFGAISVTVPFPSHQHRSPTVAN